MKKALFILLALIAVLAAVIFLKPADKPGISGITELEVSEEAKARRDYLIQSNDAEALSEGVFDAIVPALYERGEQVFPDVAVENELGSFEVNDMKVYTLGEASCEVIVLYIHGGAWTFEIDPMHISFCDALCDSMNAKVYMPLYPLAPQHTYEDTYEDIYELYSQLAAQGKRVYVMGDSAGGNITLGLTYLLKQKQERLPDAIVLISACADMSFSNPEIPAVEKNDPSLRVYGALECAKLWASDRELTEPLFSAVNADVSGYPKTLMFYGTHDIVYPDGLRLFERLQQAGVEARFMRAEGLFHVFPLSDIPERAMAIKEITEFCR